eukprot:6303252-Pyramimonas_sp.AAC.1
MVDVEGHNVDVKGYCVDAHQVEVAQVAPGDGVTAAPRGAHGRDELHVHHVAEHVVAAVPPGVVHELPQQLDGGLRAVLLERGHVEVVYEHNRLLPHGGAVDALAPLVQAPVHLKNVRSGVDVIGTGVDASRPKGERSGRKWGTGHR